MPKYDDFDLDLQTIKLEDTITTNNSFECNTDSNGCPTMDTCGGTANFCCM